MYSQHQWATTCEIGQQCGERGAHRARLDVTLSGIAAQRSDLQRPSPRKGKLLEGLFWDRAQEIRQADIGQAGARRTRAAQKDVMVLEPASPDSPVPQPLLTHARL